MDINNKDPDWKKMEQEEDRRLRQLKEENVVLKEGRLTQGIFGRIGQWFDNWLWSLYESDVIRQQEEEQRAQERALRPKRRKEYIEQSSEEQAKDASKKR